MNETTWILVAALGGFIFGCLVMFVGYTLRRNITNEKIQAELARAQAEVEKAHANTANAHAESAEYQVQLANQKVLISTAEVEKKVALEQAEQLRKDRETMLNAYKALSSEALDKQTQTMDAKADQRMKDTEKVMTSMKESVQQLQDRLHKMDKERAENTATMIAQVQSVQLAEEQLRKETSTLVKALAKPQVRGAWGELQLKRTVELAGMVDHCDFILQDTSTSDDKTIRPDMKVNLVGGKFLYVDSKTPLQGFLDAEAANTDEGYATGMEGFAKHVREHIRQLSSKNYWKADVGSPEFVILFLPSEALLQLALEYAPDLIEFAAPKNIMLATPTTLITTLRSVAYAWTQDSLAESAKEVTGLGRELYERLATMGGHFDKLARGLESAVGAYNDAVGSLEGRVLVSARKLRDLKVSEAELKELPLVTSGTRPLSAGELVDSAQEIPTTVGRSRALTAVQEVSSGSDGEGQPLDRVSL